MGTVQVKVYKGDAPVSQRMANDITPKELPDCIQLKSDLVKTILKMDLNAMIVPLTIGTNMNSFEVTNTIIDTLHIEEYVTTISNSNAEKFVEPISKILFSDVYRVALESTKINPDQDTVNTAHLNGIEGKIKVTVSKALSII